MIKNFLLVVALLPFAFSCSLFENDEEPAGLKTRTELYTLNDSLISISEEWVFDENAAITLEKPTSIQLTDNFIYILESTLEGVIKRFDYNGNFIDSLKDVRSFYTFNNFIYKVTYSEIIKYTEDFTYVSTEYSSNDLYAPNGFASGDDKNSIVAKILDFPLYVDYASNSSTIIGSSGTGQLQFKDKDFLFITKYNNLYYIVENGTGNHRVQMLNLDGTYNSEFNIETSELEKYGALSQIALNDSFEFIYGPGNASGQIQLFDKSDQTYIGFIELGEIYQSCVAVTNSKIYVVSDYPTSKIIVLDIL